MRARMFLSKYKLGMTPAFVPHLTYDLMSNQLKIFFFRNLRILAIHEAKFYRNLIIHDIPKILGAFLFIFFPIKMSSKMGFVYTRYPYDVNVK